MGYFLTRRGILGQFYFLFWGLVGYGRFVLLRVDFLRFGFGVGSGLSLCSCLRTSLLLCDLCLWTVDSTSLKPTALGMGYGQPGGPMISPRS